MDKFSDTGIASVEIFQEIEDNGESSSAVLLMEHNGVRNLSVRDHLVQDGYKFPIAINFHTHTFLSPT